MNTMHGVFLFAVSKRSLTLAAPTPTNISTKSEPEIEKKGTPASPATARASRVLPVPGGPTRRTPFGILAPSFVYLPGFFKNSTTSLNSSFASSTPATSLNVTFSWDGVMSFALLFPKENALFGPDCICLVKNMKRMKRNISGKTCTTTFQSFTLSFARTSIPFSTSFFGNSGSWKGRRTLNFSPSFVMHLSSVSLNSTKLTLPSSTIFTNRVYETSCTCCLVKRFTMRYTPPSMRSHTMKNWSSCIWGLFLFLSFIDP